MGIFAELAKSKRNREDYRAQNIRNQRKIDDLEAENRRLKRQLAAIRDFTDRALA